MQRFEAYLPDGDEPSTLDELGELLGGLGVRLEPGETYRPGTWTDPATGARAIVDLGQPPIEEDAQHPPRAYDGWRALELAVQLPLVGPHWQAVEGLALLERLLAGLPPTARLLDVEDIQATPEAEPGPFPWSRPRALASWEHLHAMQIATRTDLARMPRGDSLRLWRWRREREASWPPGTVLRHGDQAVPACVWTDPSQPCALPACGLVLVVLSTPLLLPREALPGGAPLPRAGAALVPPMAWPATGLPLAGYAACGDEDWVD